MHPPDREHVRRVAAAHEDQVLVEHRRAQILGRPGKELQPRHLGNPREPVVGPQRLLGVLGRCGSDVEQPRTLLSRQTQEELGEPVAELAAADRDDGLVGHAVGVSPLWENPLPDG